MRNLGAIGLVFLSLALTLAPVRAKSELLRPADATSAETARQQVVETVDIQGNHIIRLLYWRVFKIELVQMSK